MPTDSGRIGESDQSRFTNDVGEDLSESEIGERDDSLGDGMSGQKDGWRGWWCNLLPLRKLACWSAQRWTISVGERPEVNADLRISLDSAVVNKRENMG